QGFERERRWSGRAGDSRAPSRRRGRSRGASGGSAVIWILHDILALDLTKAPFDAGSRCALAAILAFIAALLFGRPFIAHQRRRQRLENTERGDSKRLDELHLHKKSTPTMGGAIILFASTVPALILVGPGGSAVFLLIGLSAALGLVGFLDDWIKLRYPKRKGLSARGKLVLQLAIGVAAGATLLLLPSEIRTGGTVEELGDTLAFPWSSTWVLPLGVLFVPWVAIVVTSTSNAVNLTDGLDGLAIGSSTLVAATLTALALVVGDESMSASLGLFHIEDAGEIAVWGAALCGASLGFLWFNCHPAEIFMGDTGSLPLGGSIGLM